MPRKMRTVLPRVPHHVTHRSVEGRDLFLCDDDRWLYLSELCRHCQKAGVRIDAYSLMSNHLHLVAIPGAESALAEGVGGAHESYARLHNRRYSRAGDLWHGRFFSDPMGQRHVVPALLYVELNPVQSGMVSLPWEYEWPSCGAHVGGDDPSGLLDLVTWRRHWPRDTWRKLLVRTLERREEEGSGRW